MKYVVALITGFAVGAAIALLVLYVNPFHARNAISPLSVTGNAILALNYPAVARESLVYTNNGQSKVTPNPAKVLQLWDDTIRRTTARTVLLTNSQGVPMGVGIKLSSDSEKTNLLGGRALVDSVWHIYLPNYGSLFVEQTENYWDYVKNVVIPAHRSAGNSWRGLWRGNITAGPTALETAVVQGGSGIFSGMQTEAVEALTARAYSADSGPVAVEGEITIEIPGPADTTD